MSAITPCLRRLQGTARFCSWRLVAFGSTRTAIVGQPQEQNFVPAWRNQTGSVRTFARKSFVPRKAAVKLTEKARKFFKLLLENKPRDNVVGLMLKYHQSTSGMMRMVFSFDFVTESDIDPNTDEGVSLELIDTKQADGTIEQVPKPPLESQRDGLPKLYIHHDAFLKVLGATVDIDTEKMEPIMYDREGNLMDPNA